MRLRLQRLTCFIFLVLFSKKKKKKKNHGFIEEDKPSEKVVIVEEELNRFDIDDIKNYQDLPRFVLIDEDCENLNLNGGELTRNINQRKKSDVSQQPVDVQFVENVDESIFSMIMYNIVNQLGKSNFSRGSVVNNLKYRKLL